MKDSITLDEFKKYYLDNNYNENMFNEYGSINPEYNSSKKTGVLAQIFEDHWNYVYLTKHIEMVSIEIDLTLIKKLEKLSIVTIKIWVVVFTNALIVMILFLLVILVNPVFVLLVVINIKMNV